MAHENSPSSVMYADFKELGLKNRDVALVLLDADRSFGDTTLRDRIDSRSQLSRAIVHAAPGEVAAFLFNDFPQSSQTLLSRIVSKMKERGQAGGTQAAAERFSGKAAEKMIGALREYGIDESVYRNALSRIANLGLASEADRALLYLMLFVVTGCTGDPREAASTVEAFSANRVGASFRTTEANFDAFSEPDEAGASDEGYALGLMRIVGGKLKGANAFYRIAPTEEGTEIGSLASGDDAITDVDEDVSRRHARVFKRGNGYYLVGLKSTNGISVISGADKTVQVVEPPKRDRPRDYAPEPVEIFPTDTICLGSSTRFMVMPVMSE